MSSSAEMGQENVPSFYDQPSGNYKGIGRWLLTIDHKRIGLMYLYSIMAWFAIAVVLGVLIRYELMSPGVQLLEAKTYNAAFTLHGVIMIFLFVIPSIPAVLGNFFMPMQVGAEDVFFPKINLLSWYLYILGSALAIASLFFNGFPDTGWTFYVPYSQHSTTNVSMTVLAAFILGFSSILTGVNFITTIHRMRIKEMGWFQMPLFTWTIYATSWIQVLATPIVGITLILVIFERVFGVGLFDPSKGGDPLLYQHLFWMYSHPAVYIMILPAMGIISEIFPVFSRKSIFGYKVIVWSSLAIMTAGSLVWAHHMYTSGMSDTAVFIFSLLTFVVAIPSAIKVFNWTATLYKGSIVMSPPFFLALCFIFLFSLGGLTGLILGAASSDVHVHDTQFVVGHFHFMMFGGTGFAFFAGLHYWFPKMYGKMYNFPRAYLASFLLAIGFVVHYIPMMVVGVMGMPRRYYDYDPQFHSPNYIAGFGAVLMVVGMVLMFWNLYQGAKKGEPAHDNPWGATTLEWQCPSPPPLLNFLERPKVPKYPYDFTKIFDQIPFLQNKKKVSNE
jgi:cytochrome c oxidase subunit 1